MTHQLTSYELEREARIAENKRKAQELGIASITGSLKTIKVMKAVKKSTRKKSNMTHGDVRKSARVRAPVSYCEADYPGRKQEGISQICVRRLLTQGPARNSKPANQTQAGHRRGPVDSGKGVRIQGGRVYDSKLGVCCHWCRQKTLEDHVTCTNPECGGGRRMPLSFCKMCLRNRHGEDVALADASGEWWCPACRGNCGPGCHLCCNCGPCRRKAGMEPTHQIMSLVRGAEFDNVHDYLIHLATGESKEDIAKRKHAFPWGKWVTETNKMPVTVNPTEKAAAGDSMDLHKGPVEDAGCETQAKSSVASDDRQERKAARKQRAMQSLGLIL